MITCTSISGGMTSAYLAANYPTDLNVFALVRIEDEECRYPDEVLRRRVEDRIQKPFIATAEDDKIITTIFDLEQHIGREIQWVSGITYDEVVRSKGGMLPNKLHRYCTTWMKLSPIFEWWQSMNIEPITMHIGYRANETARAARMKKKTNDAGVLSYKGVVGKHPNGKNKWATVAWQRPRFPLIEDKIMKTDIINYWMGKNVTFAEYNNCVGCFHRNPAFLRFMWQEHPSKMEWFAKQEGGRKGTWRELTSYYGIKKMLAQKTLFSSDFTSCDAGYCGM
jgi:hypothetical protein